jgi:hypothetical protein
MSKDLREMPEAKLPGDSVLRSGARPGLSTAAFPDGARIRRRSRLVCRNVADSQRQGDRSHDKAIGVVGSPFPSALVLQINQGSSSRPQAVVYSPAGERYGSHRQGRQGVSGTGRPACSSRYSHLFRTKGIL